MIKALPAMFLMITMFVVAHAQQSELVLTKPGSLEHALSRGKLYNDSRPWIRW